MSDFLDESAYLAAQRNQREQQRIGNALNILAGRNPGSAFMGLANNVQQAGMPNIEAMATNLIPSTGSLMQFGQQGYQQGVNNINERNRMNMQIADWQLQNTRNPLQEDIMFGLGVGQGLAGMAGSVMGGMTGMGMLGGAGKIAGSATQPQTQTQLDFDPTMSWLK